MGCVVSVSENGAKARKQAFAEQTRSKQSERLGLQRAESSSSLGSGGARSPTLGSRSPPGDKPSAPGGKRGSHRAKREVEGGLGTDDLASQRAALTRQLSVDPAAAPYKAPPRRRRSSLNENERKPRRAASNKVVEEEDDGTGCRCDSTTRRRSSCERTRRSEGGGRLNEIERIQQGRSGATSPKAPSKGGGGSRGMPSGASKGKSKPRTRRGSVR